MKLEEIEKYIEVSQLWPSDGDKELNQYLLGKLFAVAKAAEKAVTDPLSFTKEGKLVSVKLWDLRNRLEELDHE